MKKQLISVCIGIALALPATLATAQPGGDMRETLKQLSLSKSQRQALRENMREISRSTDRHELKAYRQQMQQLVTASSFDTEAAKALVGDMIDSSSEARFNRAQRKAALLSVLDDEQEQALQAIMSLKKRNWEDKLEFVSERWMSRLDLTDEQRATIETLQAERIADIQQQQQQRESFRKAETALIESGNFDEDSWQSLADDYRDQAVTAGVAKAHHRFKLLKVLSDEQVEQLQAMQAKMKKRAMDKREKKHRKHG